jgi:hypothetical protein
MNPEPWQRIEEFFHEALKQVPEASAEFLNQECEGDLELRNEVESLLGSEIVARSRMS